MRMTKDSVQKAANAPTQLAVFRAYLAEDYDGIAQFVTVTLNRGSVTSAARAYIGRGDSGTNGQTPRGTPVVVRADRGRLWVLSGLGSSKKLITSLGPEETGDDGPSCSLEDRDLFERSVNPGFGHAIPADVDWDGPLYVYPIGDSHNTQTSDPILLLSRGIDSTYLGFAGYALIHVPANAGKIDLILAPSAANLSTIAGGWEALSGQIANPDEFRVSLKVTFGTNYFTDGFGVFLGAGPSDAANEYLGMMLVITDGPWTFANGAPSAYLSETIELGLTKDRPSGTSPVHGIDSYSNAWLHNGTPQDGFTEQFTFPPTFEIEIDRSVERGNTRVTIPHYNGGVPYEFGVTPADPLTGPLQIILVGYATQLNRIIVPWYPIIEFDDLRYCSG